MSVFSVICLTHDRKQKPYCDNCSAVMDDQEGSDPDGHGFICSECGSVSTADETEQS